MSILDGMSGNPDAQKMMLAQALMGGNSGGPQNSFAGGLAQGISPMMRAMMMQKLMAAQNPQAQQATQGAPAAAGMPAQQPGAPSGLPYMLGGPVQQ